jgi:alcohol dehydrogenase
MVAVVSDTDKGVKVPFTSYFLLPNAAILDPRMTLTLPPHITAMTAMDAMTHAVEAFTCLAHNPISDAYATGAIRKISENLLKVMDNPTDADGRLELAQASTMAGIAFSNSMVGLVHALGHSAGAVCHLPHGLVMSLFLPYVLEYNMDVNGDRIGELLLPLAGADAYATTPRAERAKAAIAYIRALRDELYARCKLPRTLQETGKVQESQLEQIAELTINDGSIIFNPKEADREEALAILKRAWAGGGRAALPGRRAKPRRRAHEKAAPGAAFSWPEAGYSCGPALRMASETSNFLKLSMNCCARPLAASS